MTVPEALELVRQVGTVQIRGGNLKLRYPEKERDRLQPAIATLRGCKAEALAILANEDSLVRAVAEGVESEQADDYEAEQERAVL